MVNAVDGIWVAAAAALEVAVARGGDAYVHWDGCGTLYLASDEHLDADDTVAQLILHELCHFLVEGPGARTRADWGLDNTSARDAVRERAAVRLQAHLLGGYALRAHLYPTTEVRSFFDALGPDAFAGADPESAGLARLAAARAARAPFGRVLTDALAKTAQLLERPLHRTGLIADAGENRCGTCAFRAPSGLCRKAPRRVFVSAAEAACAGWEGALDCLACGACCRSAYDSVTVGPRDPIRRSRPGWVVDRGSYLELRRDGDACAALAGAREGGPFHCVIYEDRPRTCRDFERGGRHCLEARRRIGLSSALFGSRGS